MNGRNPVAARRWTIRAVLAALYIVAAVALFVTGKGHTILVDNKDDPAGAYSALRGATVSMDRQKPLDFFPRDRDKFIVRGQTHTIRVTLHSGGQEKNARFRVPLDQDMTLLSLPKLMAGIEPWTEPFVAPTAAEQAAARAEEDALNPPETFGSLEP